MGTVGSQGETLISWHRENNHHPIFNPDYARENLVSLAETLVMLYLYFVVFILSLHYLVLAGLIQIQTIPWMLIEASTRNLLYNLPAAVAASRFDVFLAIVTTVMVARLTRNSFEIVKADLHPKHVRVAKIGRPKKELVPLKW